MVVDFSDSQLLEVRHRLVAEIQRPIVEKHRFAQWRNEERTVALTDVHKVDLELSVRLYLRKLPGECKKNHRDGDSSQ